MREYQLGQALLVEPGIPFAEIAAVLERLGWERQTRPDAAKPLVEGEPEAASWWRRGRKPFVIYTFNPVVKLRVLDVATLPPLLRAAIASQLPMLDRERIAKLFGAQDPRQRLLGLWAAQETEELDLIPEADRLTNDPEPIVAEQARSVCNKLRRINEARYEALAKLRLMTEGFPELAGKLSDPAFIAALKPTAADLADLFDENLQPLLINAAEAIYSRKLRVSRLEPDATVRSFAITAGMLRWPNMLSEQFPLAYRDIAGWMNPRRVWVAWTVTTPTGGTVRYDGLAWLDGRWVWLPKIYRYLAPYLLDHPGEH